MKSSGLSEQILYDLYLPEQKQGDSRTLTIKPTDRPA